MTSLSVKKLIIRSISELLRYIEGKKPQRILLQSPNGYRNRLIDLADVIKKRYDEAEVIIEGNLNYGACDIQRHAIDLLDIDLVIHVGHSPFYRIDNKFDNIIYYPLFEGRRITKNLYSQILDVLTGYKRVGVVNSIQYYKQYVSIMKRLREDGYDVYSGESAYGHMYKGQILGCEISAAQKIRGYVDVYLVISSGLFHGLGVALWTGRPTYVVDIHNSKVVDVQRMRRRYLSKIANNIEIAKTGRRFGIIISTKLGQINYDFAEFVYKELKKLNREVYIISMDNITQEQLSYFMDIDVFIQTACPRLSIDDVYVFKKPVLNMEQFLIMIGRRSFDEVYP